MSSLLITWVLLGEHSRESVRWLEMRPAWGDEMGTTTPESLSKAWAPGSHSDTSEAPKGTARVQRSRRALRTFVSAFNKENFIWKVICHSEPDRQAWKKKSSWEWLSGLRPWDAAAAGPTTFLAPDQLSQLLPRPPGLSWWGWGNEGREAPGPPSVSVPTDYNVDFCLVVLFDLVVPLLFFLFSTAKLFFLSLSFF